MGGGRMGAPGKSTLDLWHWIRAMIVLALAEVNLSSGEGETRGVQEPEFSSGLVGGSIPNP